MRPVHIAGVGLWTPGFATPQAWADRRHDPSELRPGCAMLQSRIGRYTSLVTRMAVAALEQAAARSGTDMKEVQTVSLPVSQFQNCFLAQETWVAFGFQAGATRKIG